MKTQHVIPASALEWAVPVQEWPSTVEWEGQTWRLDHLTTAQRTGEVQCGEYAATGDQWLIIYNSDE